MAIVAADLFDLFEELASRDRLREVDVRNAIGRGYYACLHMGINWVEACRLPQPRHRSNKFVGTHKNVTVALTKTPDNHQGYPHEAVLALRYMGRDIDRMKHDRVWADYRLEDLPPTPNVLTAFQSSLLQFRSDVVSAQQALVDAGKLPESLEGTDRAGMRRQKQAARKRNRNRTPKK